MNTRGKTISPITKDIGLRMGKVLVVTEKGHPLESQRDGGYQLVQKLIKAFGDELDIMQFCKDDCTDGSSCKYHYQYPISSDDRFLRRILNGEFIAKNVKEVEGDYEIILFVHVSLQFGFVSTGMTKVVTFPMFTGYAYRISGEKVTDDYISLEREALGLADIIISPSYVEKQQLMFQYGVPKSKIRVIPRAVQLDDLPIVPGKRLLNPLRLCSIGSIKPQKNTIVLIKFFALISDIYPNAELTLIGPIQDSEYHALVLREIHCLRLSDKVKFSGFVPHDQLIRDLNDKQIHVCLSKCETFGRSIFETLAVGLPNICFYNSIAAADFIPENLGIRFISSTGYGIDSLEELLSNPPSQNDAHSIRQLFGSSRLNSLLKSTVTGGESLVVSDFDGTLFHKDSATRTQTSISAFLTYPVRVICSSRSVPDLLNKCRELAIEANYFIGWGGAVITDLKGEVIWIRELSDSECKLLEIEDQTAQPLSFCDKVIQYSSSVEPTTTLKAQFSIQEFQSKFYFNSKSGTKLLAITKLLDIIDWKGLVEAFGDGQYDWEYLKYFDGTLVTLENSPLPYLKSAPSITRHA